MSGSDTIANSQPSQSWSQFLADNKIVPISLITILDIAHCQELTGNRLVLPEPHKRFRELETQRQSNGGRKPSNYARLTRGGLPIQDNGFEISALGGITNFGRISNLLSHYKAATYTATNENKLGQGSSRWKKKLELRYKELEPNRTGQVRLAPTISALQSIDDESLIDIRVWVNPGSDEDGWWRVNLVIRCWDQNVNGKVLESARVDLPAFEIENIPALDIEAVGFQFGS